jgi:uncharacterized repeat protein (TIGR01451 family)
MKEKTMLAQWVVGILLLMPMVLLAQEAGSIRLKNEVFKELAVVNAKGEKEYKLLPPGLAVPGNEIVYITTFTNVGTQAATDIVITNPLPENSLYKAGTAFGAGTEITYSIDGGQSYDLPANLKVKNADGETETATAKDYNAIKWVFKNTLAPGAESTVMFRTIIQ